jgi:hypothetical protein
LHRSAALGRANPGQQSGLEQLRFFFRLSHG